MKDIKSIISARIKEGATAIKNVVVYNIAPYGEKRNNRQGYILTLNKDVPSMVTVDDDAVADAEAKVAEAEAALAALGEKDDKTEAEAAVAAAKEYLASLETSEYVKGERNVIFTSNFELIGLLKSNPRTKFLARMAQADEDILLDLIDGATVNILCEDVEEGEEYLSPFTYKDEGSTVEHDSVYHSLYNLVLSDEGESWMKELKKIQLQITKERMMKAMRRSSNIDDDEDDED